MSSSSDPGDAGRLTAQELFESFLESHDERDEVAFERLCSHHGDRANELRRLRALWLRLSSALDGAENPGVQAETATARTDSTPAMTDTAATPVDGDSAQTDPARSRSSATEANSDPAEPAPDPGLDQLLQRLARTARDGLHLIDRREIARGGMGRILRTWDDSLRRTLAMKVLLGTRLADHTAPDDRDARRQLSRFLEEAQITGQLDHPGIVPVHELGIDDEGQLYFTMRLVRGRSLRSVFELLAEGSDGWTLPRALGVLLKVCHAVAFAHSKGVIHRDLKPANIMVGRFGETYVMDWGLAKVLGREDTHDLRPAPETTSVSLISSDRAELGAAHPESPLLTMDGTVVGTPAYMSPEQARGLADEVGPQTDVYAVGAMLYQLLTGSKPYVAPGEDARAREILERVLAGPPAPVPQLARATPPELVAICHKAMARDVDARYPDLSAMASELDAFLEGRVVGAYSTGALAQLSKWVSRHRSVAALMLLVLAAITVALIFTLDLNADLSERTSQLQQRELALEAAVDAATAARASAEEQSAAKDVALADRSAALAFAERQRRLSERSRYVASLGAIDGALASAEVASARRLLSECPDGLRGWEWRHLSLLSDPGLSHTQAHQGSATAVAFHPGGQLVATVGVDGGLHLWDPADGSPVVTLRSSGFALSAVAFSPDGSTVAAAGWGDRVLRWELASGRTGEPLLLADDSEVLRDSAVSSLAFSPDGRTLYAGTDLDHVVTFELPGGTRRTLRQLHTGPVTSLALFDGGRRLLTGSSDRSALIWDAARGEPLLQLFENDAPLWAVAASPTTDTVATGSGDGRLALFDARSGRLIWQDRQHQRAITCLAFSPDGEVLASGSGDRTLLLSDAHDGHALATLVGHDNEITALAFDAAGERLASVDVDGVLRFWDGADRGARATLGNGGQAHSAPLSALIAGDASTPRLLVSAGLDGRLGLWDSTTRILLATVELDHEGPTPLALAPSGRLLASGDGSSGRGRDHPITLFDLSDPQHPRRLSRTLSGHEQAVVALAFSHDGVLLASASRDRTLRIWDAVSGLLTQSLRGHQGQVLALAFHPGRRLLASGGIDESLRLWDGDSGAELASLERLGSQVGALAYSPDGSLLAVGTGNGGLSLHDGETLELLLELPGHQGELQALAFHPDQARLVSTADDGTLRLWDTDDGAELLVLRPGSHGAGAGWAGATLDGPTSAGEPWAGVSTGSWTPARSLCFSANGEELFASAGRRINVYQTRPTGEGFALRLAAARRDGAARQLVDELLDRHVDPRLVELALGDESDLDPQLREDALRVLHNFGSDAEHLGAAAWSVVAADFDSPTRCARALRQARAAAALQPNRARFLNLLAMALYRSGDDAAAQGLFERAWTANLGDHDHPSSWDLYFLSMISARGGDEAGARAYLAQAQEVSASGLDDDHEATAGFAAEARRLLP